ncbi:LLM class flavin-dependent oxidoreductase [Subtercola endophyticus]|uniref:LLM class flavin-dependent oxidoreductase n=1 Tax=Subtercola endophyticus TaxID=2895559 RepID=UPI001E37471F|nr:LLM class flavin-dependent oxidoreductase [Subtercola endophyticus]UFS60657.1 LLM class flavin-dependent oxidoreductase [Subtercola endophyticus]
MGTIVKQIIMGAFEINGVNLTSQGVWAHPEQQSYRYKDLSYWTDLAQLLEKGFFDFLFLADSYGYPSMNGETPDVAFEQAVEIPKNDPMLLVPALAAATSHLAFAVTTSTTFEAPFANARRFATLDHLTQGRIAWNVVTTSSAVVSDLFGRDGMIPHDERYAIAQEYLDVSYDLFEGGWDDDSVVADKSSRVYADPAKVHKIHHHGRYFRVDGYFNCEPSPQRTPVLFQAGSSASGQRFASQNAELVFLQGKDANTLKAQVANLRSGAVAAGRSSDAIKAIVGLSIVVAETHDEAVAKLDDFLSYVNPDAARIYYSSMTGIDLAKLDPERSFATVTTEGGRTQVERYKENTVREATADFLRNGMREFIMVGTPVEIADQIEALVEETGIDGFNYTPFVSPGSYRDLVELVVPELQRRGLMRTSYPAGTFRERLFGEGAARLPATHPGASHRTALADASA